MDYGSLKHVGRNHLRQQITVKAVKYCLKRSQVDVCCGFKPNSKHITKTDEL